MNWDIVFYTIGIPLITLFWNSVFKVFLTNRSFRHNREIFILQKRFEKEVELSQKIWDVVSEILIILNDLHVDSNEEQKKRRRLYDSRFSIKKLHNNLKILSLKSKPYFSFELNYQLNKLDDLITEEYESINWNYLNQPSKLEEISILLGEVQIEIKKVLDPKRK